MSTNYSNSLMERSGLGLLPGLVLALAIGLLAMAALLIETMWAVLAVLGVVVLMAVAVVAVVLALAGEDEDEGRLRRHIPGLDNRAR